MSKGSIPYEESTLYPLLHDDEFAANYLTECLHDTEPALFLLALRQITEARNIKMTGLAQATGLDRAGLYRMLSEKGNPELSSLNTLLDALGFEIAIKTKAVG